MLSKVLPVIVFAAHLSAQVSPYPGSPDTDATLGVGANRVSTKLSAGISAGDTTIHVVSATRIVANTILTIRTSANSVVEYVWVCNVVGTTLTIGKSSCPNADGRGVDGTTAANHSSQEIVEGNVNAYYQKAAASAIKAIQTNLGTRATFVSTDYDFPAQSPGGSLVIGNNAITMAPVPLGVNGSDVGHYLYIPNGTGTPEACLINGGSGTAGQASGQIIINCSGTHSGSWTIRSASGGIAEAAIASGGQGAVTINAAATSPIQIHAPITVPSGAGRQVTFMGNGRYELIVQRATDFLNGNLFQFINNQTSILFSGIGINGDPSSGTPTGRAIYSQNTHNVTFQTGAVFVSDCLISGGQYGISYVGTSGEMRDTQVFMFNPAYKPVAGIEVNGAYDGSTMRPASNFVFHNVSVGCAGAAVANVCSYAMDLNGIDGAQMDNVNLAGDISLNIRTTGNNYNTLIYLDHLLIDSARTNAIRFSSDGTGIIAGVNISNSHISGALNSTGVDMGCTVTGSITNVHLTNNDITNNWLWGACLNVGSSISLVNNRFIDNNMSNGVGISAMHVVAAGSTLRVEGNTAYDTGLGHTKSGLTTVGAIDGVVALNNFAGVSSTPMVLGAAMTGVLGYNVGVDNISSPVTAAATLALPATTNFSIVGSTGITAVTTVFPAGTRGTFIGGGGTITSGASIGSTCSTSATKLYTWYWDGTKFWPNGPGC